MKQCPKCGLVVDNENAKFCKKCGTPLIASDTPVAVLEVRQPNPKRPKRNKLVISLWIIISLIFLFSVVCLVWNASDAEEDTTDDAFPVNIEEEVIPIEQNASVKDPDAFRQEDPTSVSIEPSRSAKEKKEDQAISLLEQGILEEKKNLPADQGSGMVLTDLRMQGDYVVYVYKCDEDLLDIDLLRENTSKELIQKVLGESTDKTLQYFVKLCKTAHKGVAFTYVGSTTRNTATVRLPYQDLPKFND